MSVGLTSTPVNTIMVLSHGTLPYSYRETLDETHRVSFDHRYLRRHNSSVCRNRTFAQILPELFWLTEQWGGIVQKSRTQCTSRPEAAARGRGRESQQNTWAKRTAPTSTRVVCEETGHVVQAPMPGTRIDALGCGARYVAGREGKANRPDTWDPYDIRLNT